jgi:hypothetical protein
LLRRWFPSSAHEPKLERQLNELKEYVRRQGLLNSAPVYCRDGTEGPDGIDPERLVVIRRVFVDPPPHEDVEIPAAPASVPEAPIKGFDGQLTYPKLGLV